MTRALPALIALLAVVLVACQRAPSQIPTVEQLTQRSKLIRIACLDSNGDGRVNGGDVAGALDITGDGAVDDTDRDVLRIVDIGLQDGASDGCSDTQQPGPDWQVTLPAQTDCEVGQGGLLIAAIGGGAVQLDDPRAGAGVRWMMAEIGAELYAEGIPHQLVSVAPGLNGTAEPHADGESWASAFLATQLARTPCLDAVVIGHSHGGAGATAVGARLEEAGLANQVLLIVPVDRSTALYSGDVDAYPQTIPVFNVYQTNDDLLTGTAINQTNVENWDASDVNGPKNGERGGRLEKIDHTNIDNSEAVLDEVLERVLAAACGRGLC